MLTHYLLSLLSIAAMAPASSLEFIANEAVTKNSEIAFYEAQIAIAKGQRLDAGKHSNPTLSSQLGTWNVRGTGDGPAWQASVSQTFEWAGRLSLRKAIADRQIELAELGLASFKASLGAKVRGLAMQLLVAQEKLTAMRAAQKRIEDVLSVLVQRDPAGAAPLLEMRILEANVLTLSRDATKAKREVDATRLELNLLRGARPEADLEVTSNALSLPAAPSLDELTNLAQKENFDLRSRMLELRQQGFEVSLARNERGPAVTVQPYLAKQKAGANNETSAGISVSLPFPLWSRNEGNIAAAEARQQQAQAAMMITARQVDKDVVEHAKAYATLAEDIAHTPSDAMAKFKDAAEQGDRHYQLGAIPVSTYIELQKSYLDALDALLSTKAEALAELQALELLTNHRLLPRA